MSHRNTGSPVELSVGFTGWLLGMPTARDPFVVFALGHPNDNNHLILPKRLVHKDLLLWFLMGPVQFFWPQSLGSPGSPLGEPSSGIEEAGTSGCGLKFLSSCFLLSTSCHFFLVKVFVLCLMPVLIETPFALIADMLGRDGLKGLEAS